MTLILHHSRSLHQPRSPNVLHHQIQLQKSITSSHHLLHQQLSCIKSVVMLIIKVHKIQLTQESSKAHQRRFHSFTQNAHCALLQKAPLCLKIQLMLQNHQWDHDFTQTSHSSMSNLSMDLPVLSFLLIPLVVILLDFLPAPNDHQSMHCIGLFESLGNKENHFKHFV